MRHQNGFGSIVCLDKTGKKRRKPYAVRITTGWKNGRQQRKYIGYYKTQAEALIALAEYHKNGADIDLTALTLNDVWNRWFERVEKKNLTKSALGVHRAAHGKMGDLLNMKMKDIRVIHLQQWIDDMSGMPRTKDKYRSTMVQLFEYAVVNDIVQKNYAKYIEINEKAEKTGSVFTPDEIKTLWENRDNKFARILLILIYTGMRVGELIEIKRDHINLEDQYIIGGNKTEAGRNRVIPIHDKILPLVELELGQNDHLIVNSHGGAATYHSLSRQINALLDKFGMDHKIHDTRKTAVSLYHSAGIPMETIRVIVGHSGKGVTEKIYLYKDPKELVEIVNTLEINY